VLRMEVTRSNELAVQALYRVRSAQQRLPIQLPGAAEFDTDPLRINGRSVALEQGGEDDLYFVPLTGQTTGEPFLLELRYTLPGNHRRLSLPEFPARPAVQKVYLCVYLPRERALLGARGPWTDESDWRWYQPRPPQQSDLQLIQWVTEGLDVTDPAAGFGTDGRLHTFSTFQPAASPGDSSLRLTAVNDRGLRAALFMLVLVVGVALIRQPLVQKFAAVVLLAALMLLAGVFAPLFARQVLDPALLSALLLVAALWSIWYAVRFSQAAWNWRARRVPSPAMAGADVTGSPFADAPAVEAPPDIGEAPGAKDGSLDPDLQGGPRDV
jgi:hypothetical protein